MNTEDLQLSMQAHVRRLTSQKRIVFELLQEQDATTMLDLRKRAEGRISQTTLYRILGQFRDQKIIRDIVINGVRKIELTEWYAPHHHHIACSNCTKIVTINDQRLEQYLKQLAKKHGFDHSAHSFEITGLCKDCLPASRYQKQ